MLSPEQRAAFAAKLDVPESVVETTESNQETVSDTPVEPTPSTTSSEQKEERRSIPYARFHEVNSRAKQAEERAAKLEQELQALRGTTGSSSSQPKSFLDELIEQEQAGQDKPAVDEELVARISDLERVHASNLLDKTILQAQKDYPDLPEDILLAAIGAKLSVEEAVGVWDDMKQRVLKATGATQHRQAPATPPLPGKVPPAGQPKPRTLEEAHIAFRRYLQRQT